MGLADETIISANGWEQFETANKGKSNQEHLDFAHKIAKTFGTSEGQEVLEMLVKRYLLADIVQPNDTQFSAGIKQGRASVVKQILANIEISNNTK